MTFLNHMISFIVMVMFERSFTAHAAPAQPQPQPQPQAQPLQPIAPARTASPPASADVGAEVLMRPSTHLRQRRAKGSSAHYYTPVPANIDF